MSPIHNDEFSFGLGDPFAPIVPEGWKLVPKVATEEMCNAGANGYHSTEMMYLTTTEWAEVKQTWEAMLAAAPTYDGGESK